MKYTAIVMLDASMDVSAIGKTVIIELEDGTQAAGIISAVVAFQETVAPTINGVYTIQSGSINLSKA